jgi:hypothetical protein
MGMYIRNTMGYNSFIFTDRKYRYMGYRNGINILYYGKKCPRNKIPLKVRNIDLG